MDVSVRTANEADHSDGDHQLLIRALNHLPAMIAFWDSDARNVLANDAYVEWFGKTPAQMRGMHIRDLLGPQAYAKNLPYISAVLAGSEQLFERTLIDAAGQTRYSQAHYIPDTDGTGQVRGFFVLVADITRRVHAESSLEDLNDTMTALRQAITPLRDAMHAPDTHTELMTVIRSATELLGFAPTVNFDDPAELIPLTVAPQMLAVLRESLTNTAKHAHATAVQISITTLGQETRLQVMDNGRGIRDTDRSSGLSNIRARAERLGGTARICPNDPVGTIVDWRVPTADRG